MDRDQNKKQPAKHIRRDSQRLNSVRLGQLEQFVEGGERYNSADKCEHGNRRPQYEQENKRNEYYGCEYTLEEFQSGSAPQRPRRLGFVQSAVTALARLIFGYGFEKVQAAEFRPEGWHDVNFRVCQLP